jgi:hypothetical protein
MNNQTTPVMEIAMGNVKTAGHVIATIVVWVHHVLMEAAVYHVQKDIIECIIQMETMIQTLTDLIVIRGIVEIIVLTAIVEQKKNL